MLAGLNKRTQILLADDHEIVRQGTLRLIEKVPDLQVCGEAGDGEEAVAMARKLKPDVVVLDVDMPGMSGVEAMRQIKRLAPKTEILVFTAHDTSELVHEVFEAGARSLVLKTDAVQYLVTAIREVAQHRPFLTPGIAEIVLERYVKGSGAVMAQPTAPKLTARESEVLKHLAEGNSNKDIARALDIDVKTVETHRAAIMRKMGFNSLSDLVRYAIRKHIIQA
jgi:DNA-binding NarL/FixJ family response regulator